MNPKDDPIQASLERFLPLIPPGALSVEKIPLLPARGRILAADVTATIDDPPYARSIMEGYVVVAPETAGASIEQPVTLQVIGEIPVGVGEAKGFGPGKALRVTTGSWLPSGDYAVVRQFDVAAEGDRIRLTRPVKKDDNIETQGCEQRKGALLFTQGHRLTPADLFVLAGQGILDVSVARRPRVAIFSSGNEVISPTEPFRIGAIWDCNSYGLSALVEESGGLPFFKGIVKDDFDLFSRQIKEALSENDMIVISGGTAVGGRDFTADLVDAAGSPGAVVKGIPMRSGKPIVLGVAGGKPIICVAGHPPEAARGFTLFGRPALGRLLGERLPAIVSQ